VAEPLLRVEDLRVAVKAASHRQVTIVEGFSATLEAGCTLGIVGESGSGKSTLLRCLAGLVKPASGRIYLEGKDITGVSRKQRRELGRRIQMVFQDPIASLNPMKKVGTIISLPLVVHRVGTKAEIRERVGEVARQVGLSSEILDRYPYELSGGQAQRVALARALAISPSLLLCDEPVSALDVSVQAQILELLTELQERLGFGMVFVSHDLAVIRAVSHSVAVFYLGRTVEEAPAEEIFEAPAHPYTSLLLSSAPEFSALPSDLTEPPKLDEPPSFLSPPAGCHFHPRCPYAGGPCARRFPERSQVGQGHFVRCYFPLSYRSRAGTPAGTQAPET
jgi:peptide/nickel transport system ATP-binding protein